MVTAFNPSAAQKDFEFHDPDDPIPEELGTGLKPEMFRLFVLPIRPLRKSAGGVYIPDQAVEYENWLSMMGRVAAIGEGCFKRTDMFGCIGSTLGDRIKRGDFIIYAAKAPQRFQFKGARILIINDNWISGTVDPEYVRDLKFNV